MTTPIAHIKQTLADTACHDLETHLREVACRAEDNCRGHSTSWVRLACLWHDLGKYRPGFQRYIRQDSDAHTKECVVPRDKTHSTAGALLALDKFGTAGQVLAYLIASHHAGLYDGQHLRARLQDPDARRELDEALAAAPATLLETDFIPDLSQTPGGRQGFALWLRMLFSALVDADFLDTERFMDEGKTTARGVYPTLDNLTARFDNHMAAKQAGAPDTPVNRLRADVLRQCRAGAVRPPGIYSLTVPTGGGKTLSSLAFALDHARAHGKRRIIYAIPYTSIVEQTSSVFADIFGAENILEHHSQAESDPADETARSRLASENWDAPLIVTTNVQLFESLFAARTSRCRKLHNLINSVIILDEAQCLPPEFLQPILDALNLLARHYGVTVLLCTATQPALASKRYFDAARNRRGLDDVTELIERPDTLYRALKRIDVRLPADWHTTTEWEALAAQLIEHDCVLAIVNTRVDARTLWKRLPPGTLHLSALMCGAHRASVIAEIRRRLEARRSGHDTRPLRVVSTQLVEAGVDLDFPVVYRAFAGLDSLAQAAGRCNREGRLERGEVVVFHPPTSPPPGPLRQAADACLSVLQAYPGDPLALELFEPYFDRLYYGIDLDAKGIVRDLTPEKNLDIQFRTVAENFRLIDDEDQASVFVRYAGHSGIDALLGQLEKDGPERWLMRKLQRCAVNIPRRQLAPLLAGGDIAEVRPGCYVQRSDLLYDEQLGLLVDGTKTSPDKLIL